MVLMKQKKRMIFASIAACVCVLIITSSFAETTNTQKSEGDASENIDPPVVSFTPPRPPKGYAFPPTVTYEYGLVSPNIEHNPTPGDHPANSYDECRQQAEDKGDIAWGMQSYYHGEVLKYNLDHGWCWSVKILDHFTHLDHYTKGGPREHDEHVQGCVDITKRISFKCMR